MGVVPRLDFACVEVSFWTMHVDEHGKADFCEKAQGGALKAIVDDRVKGERILKQIRWGVHSSNRVGNEGKRVGNKSELTKEERYGPLQTEHGPFIANVREA